MCIIIVVSIYIFIIFGTTIVIIIATATVITIVTAIVIIVFVAALIAISCIVVSLIVSSRPLLQSGVILVLVGVVAFVDCRVFVSTVLIPAPSFFSPFAAICALALH